MKRLKVSKVSRVSVQTKLFYELWILNFDIYSKGEAESIFAPHVERSALFVTLTLSPANICQNNMGVAIGKQIAGIT
jgi:hypothetical protein